jgi:molybdate transport system permease protein
MALRLVVIAVVVAMGALLVSEWVSRAVAARVQGL